MAAKKTTIPLVEHQSRVSDVGWSGGFQVRRPEEESRIAYLLGVSRNDEAAKWLREHEAPGQEDASMTEHPAWAEDGLGPTPPCGVHSQSSVQPVTQSLTISAKPAE